MKKRLTAMLLVVVLVTALALPASAAAKLTPIYLGYVEVDYLAEQILKDIPTAGKSAKEQIRAVYDYIIRNYKRDGGDGTEYFDMNTVNQQAVADMPRMEQMLEDGQILLREELETGSHYDPSTGVSIITYGFDSNYLVATYAYDMILHRVGNCVHYSALLTLLLSHLGYDCRMIPGDFINRDGSRVEHKWNCVLVDGQYYWLDVRMDHAGYDSTGKISYTYFMKTSKAEWENRHSWDATYSDWLFANAKTVSDTYNKQLAEALGPWGLCSDWARETMEQAGEDGLIPERLAGTDLSLAISREEFAAVAVNFYEALTGKKVPAFSGPSPFTDTDDADVLRAYSLGIVGGTSADKYSPKSTLTREQAVVMLGRAWELVENGAVGDGSGLSSADLTAFRDGSAISGYAVPYVGFFVGEEIMNGMGDGSFSPQGNMTREQAIKVAFTAVDVLA